MAQADSDARMGTPAMESRSSQADLITHGVMSVPGGPPLSRPQQQQQQRPAQVDRGSATDRAVWHHVENNARMAGQRGPSGCLAGLAEAWAARGVIWR